MIKDVKNFVDGFLSQSYADIEEEGSWENMRNVRNDSGLFHVDEETTITAGDIVVEDCVTRGYDDKNVVKGLADALKASGFVFNEVDSSPFLDNFVMVEGSATYTISIWFN